MPEEYIKGKDVPLLPDGSTYHLGVKAGQIYPLLITVGSKSRAERMSKCLDSIEHEITSDRLFTIFSGKYKNKGVSIVAIGMGMPMMDFFLREAAFVLPVDEPIVCIRVGTCGLWKKEHPPGTIAIASESIAITTNYSKTGDNYLISDPLSADSKLSKILTQELLNLNLATASGPNGSAEFFYSTQGRKVPGFDDPGLEKLNQKLEQIGLVSCEMETHTLYHLAKLRRAPTYTACCLLGIINRVNPDMPNISGDKLHELETKTGIASLNALVSYF